MSIFKFLKNFYSIYIFVVFVLVVFAAPFVGFQFKRNYDCDNIWFFLLFVILIIGSFFLLYYLRSKLEKVWFFLHSKWGFYWVFGIGSAVMLVLQFCLVSGGWFIAGWDTRNVIFPDIQMNGDYMSMYQNQLFLAGFFRSIYFFLTNLGLSFEDYYFCLVLLSALVVAFSIMLLGLIAKKLFEPFIAILVFLAGVLFVGFSPYILIPYSDTFGLFCTTIILFLFVYINNKPAKCFLICFFSTIGYFIKPTVLIALFAIILIILCKFLSKVKVMDISYSKNKLVMIFASILFAVFGFGSAAFISSGISNYGVEINDDNSFGITHFLMMGINLETRGAWNDDDVNISRSYKNVEEREAGNIAEWQNRINIYGLPGISWIFFNKTLTNYADGNFTWESETPWMLKNCGRNPVIWALYGIDEVDNHDDTNNFMAYVRQIMWFLILLGCAFTFFRKKLTIAEYVVICTLLGISAFLTIFEPDARYMFLYVPYMVLLAPSGWQVFYRRLNKKFVPSCVNFFTELASIIKIEYGNEKPY